MSCTTRREFTLSLGALISTTGRALATGASRASISAADFGALPNGSDAGPGFAKATAELTRFGGGKLIIPPGIYTFTAESGVALSFTDISELDIEAYGAEFLFLGSVWPFIFRNCRAVRFRGLAIGWARAPFSQGDVEDVAPDGKSAVVAFDAITPMDRWSHAGASAIGEYDRRSGLIARRGLDIYNVIDSVGAIDERHARLNFKWPIQLKSAATIVLRHAMYACAIVFHDCSDIKIDSVTVYSAPGMAFVGGRCRNLTLERCVVEPRPGSGLLMSTSADAVHLTDCSGIILIDNCRFGRMGDDGVNVNSTYWRIAERPNSRTAIVSNRWNLGFQKEELAVSGHIFEFASGRTLESRGDDEVVSTASATSEPRPTRETLRFARDLPEQAQAGDVIIDKSRMPILNVRNCVFDGNRARGVLAHKNATIEKCVFRHQSAQGVLLCPDLFWMEGPEVVNVRVVNNIFDDVDRWELKQGAILVDAVVTGPSGRPQSSLGHPNHGVVIKNNEYRNLQGPPVVIRATQ